MDDILLTLRTFGKAVVNSARYELGTQDKKVTERLFKSLNYEVTQLNKGIYIVDFLMEKYGLYIDKGVSGTKVKRNTPYAFRSKGGKQGLKGMPPPSKFDQWTVRRGIAPRDAKGRFLPRKQVDFAIARSVFEKGIKPSLFFTKPFDKYFAALAGKIGEDFNLNIIQTIKKLEENGKN